MTGGSVTRYVQTGTGQIALLYFDEQTQTWSVDLFRQVDATCERMASWAARGDAVAALERMQFAPDTNL